MTFGISRSINFAAYVAENLNTEYTIDVVTAFAGRDDARDAIRGTAEATHDRPTQKSRS